MNWTGGRLQRHSRANTNATLKAQKQHFARARLRQQHGQPAPSPLRLSAFKVPPTQYPNVDRDQHRGVKRQGSTDALASDEPRTKGRHFGNRPSTCANVGLEGNDCLRDRNDAVGLTAHKDLEREHRKSAQAERNTLDAVKRSLLRRSDWMGLSAARPVHLNFPSAHELENIGRRRKMTLEDEKRQKGARARRYHCSGLDPVFRHDQPRYRANNAKLEDASVRIGSNIHHSQATPLPSQAQKPASLVCQSQSSESMLLDKEVSSVQEVNNVSGTFSNVLPALSKTTKTPRGTGFEGSLPSLDQLRESETFDQVKARSNSMGGQNRADEQQKSPEEQQRRAADGSLASEVAVSSPGAIGYELSEIAPLPSETNILQSELETQQPHPSSGEQGLQQIPDNQSDEFSSPGREGDSGSGRTGRNILHSAPRLTFRAPSSPSTSQPSRFWPTNGESQRSHRPNFTLELQVKRKAQNGDWVGTMEPDKTQMADLVGHEGDGSSLGAYAKIAADGPRKTSKNVGLAPKDPSKRCNTSTRDDAPRRLEVGESRPSFQRTDLLETGNTSITASSNASHAREAAQDHTQKRQLLQEHLVRRRLGKPAQSPFVSEGKHGVAEVQNDEKLAWTRSILKNNPANASSHFNCSPCVGTRWVDETLPEDHQLQTTRSQHRSRFSPRQTAMTTANATIHESEPNLEACALDNTCPSETDFLSRFSPMQGQLDESLLNLSVYTNPARSERSYIATLSQTPEYCKSGVRSEFVRSLPKEFQDSSSGCSSPAYDKTQKPGIHDPLAPLSCPDTTKINPLSQRTPLKVIPNLFAGPRRSSFSLSTRVPEDLEKSLESPSTTARSPEPEILGYQSIRPAPSANRTLSSARHQSDRFPVNYTPIRPATKKRQQGCSVTSQLDMDQSDIVARTPHHTRDSRVSSRSPSSYHPIQHPHTSSVAGRFMNSDSTPNGKKNSHSYRHEISAAAPNDHPSCRKHGTPLCQRPLSPGHFVFQEPPPSLVRKPLGRLRAAPPSNHKPMRRPLPQPQLDPFSTPRPRRKPSPQPGQGAQQPFSTPRPARSALGQFQRPQKPIVFGDYEGG